MIGFVDINPAHFSVLLNRKHYWPHTVLPEEDWPNQLKKYLETDNVYKRTRVVIIDNVNVVRTIVSNGLSNKLDDSIIVLFGDPKVMDTLGIVNIVDAKLNGTTWEIHTVIPERLHNILKEAKKGISGALKPITKEENPYDMPKKKDKKKPLKEEVKLPKEPEKLPEKPVIEKWTANPEPPKFFDKIDTLLESITDDNLFNSTKISVAKYYEGVLGGKEWRELKAILPVDIRKKLNDFEKVSIETGLLDKYRIATREIVNGATQEETSSKYNIRNWDLNWLKAYNPFESISPDML